MSALPRRHSFRRPKAIDFSGQNVETPGYPPVRVVHPDGATYWQYHPLLGIDSQETYRQALTGLSWLSYSRPSISSRYPDQSRSDSCSHERTGSPRRLRLSGLLRAPNPLGGFVADGHSPTLSMTTRDNDSPRACPHRPRLRPGGLDNIG